MSRIVNRAEVWEKTYDSFQQINFAAWDFDTIKESMLDYMKIYHPEEFNDYIESSEFITHLELFAYMGELMAYRYDMNAHENFITVAERKESVLRLVKLLSYDVSRNIPSRGLVKITSISTTEKVFDSNGLSLANRTITWNDTNNVNWKEQFITVMDRVLEQNFGTVLPSDRIQVQDVLFELYSFNNIPLNNNIFPYTVSVSGNQYPMELVSSELDEYGPLEKRPEKNLKFSIVYLNDGLGDSSDNTGFFVFTKQGKLNRITTDFDGVTPNQTFDVNYSNTNEIDVWVNNIDADTGEVLIDEEDFTSGTKLGEWESVDVANARNILFNTNPNRNKYEIETLDDDKFRLIFGDANFANIPSGKFEIWFRTSANEDLTIPTTAIQNINSSFSYIDSDNIQQKFSFSYSLLTPIQNSAPTETIDRIRRIAPSVYYTQDRMVNGKDYNEFMLQDNSILKLRTINRTFAGDSKYIGQLFDASEQYDNVKIFGDDGVVYYNTDINVINVTADVLPDEDGGANVSLIKALVLNHIQPLLSSSDLYTRFLLSGVLPSNIRNEFSSAERLELDSNLLLAINNTPSTFYLDFNSNTPNGEWLFYNTEPSTYWISIQSNVDDSWTIRYISNRLIFHSDETKFFVTNNNNSVLTNDTLNTNLDTLVILSANLGADNTCLTKNYFNDVTGQVVIKEGEYKGIESIHDIYIVPDDENGDGIPDNVSMDYLIDDTLHYVYFYRDDVDSPWVYTKTTEFVLNSYANDTENLWKREIGKEGINFLWQHRTPRYNLIDPSTTNIMDTYIITRGYYKNLVLWLNNKVKNEPIAPTPFQLRNDFGYLLGNAMLSDTVILHTGKIKPIIGEKSKDELRATIKIIRSSNNSVTNNQLKTVIVDLVLEFFDINKWEFGETFYFSELSAFIHARLAPYLDSVVLVPLSDNHVFGDLYQVFAKEDEIIQPSISVNDISIVQSLDPRTLKQIL
jgi:hypothetical protein